MFCEEVSKCQNWKKVIVGILKFSVLEGHVLFSKYIFFHSTTAEVSLYALLVVKRKKEAKFGACAISSK